MLEVRGLVKRFGGLAATDGASFTVDHGELHALIGPNGAGKTTLIHQLSGALAPDEGRIVFNAVDVTRRPMHARVKDGLARSYQITSVFGRCSVRDNLTLAVQAAHGSSFSFWRPAIAARQLVDEALGIAKEVGLEHRFDVPVHSLSHGEQRQLEVALALAVRPKLLLLDEPLAGMGPEESERMVDLIASLKGRITILLVEHDMHAVFRLADRVSVLVLGRVVASGTPETIRNHPEVKRAYLGEELAATTAMGATP